MKKDREIFWYRHQKGDGGGGWRVPPLSSLIKVLYILLDPLPQHTFEDDRISQKVLKKEKHVLEQATLLYWLPQSDVGKKSLSFSPWEPQTPFFFLRALDPFLLLGDPGLINLPRNWLSVVMNISQCICKSSHQVEHLHLYNICQLYLNARGEIDFKETLNIFKLFFMSQTCKVLIILYWWALWQFMILFSCFSRTFEIFCCKKEKWLELKIVIFQYPTFLVLTLPQIMQSTMYGTRLLLIYSSLLHSLHFPVL